MRFWGKKRYGKLSKLANGKNFGTLQKPYDLIPLRKSLETNFGLCYIALKIEASMRIAVIDMGTNTFHLIIVEVALGDFKIIFRQKDAVKIGENGINHGMITEAAILRAMTTLSTFKEIIADHGVSQTFATATSAIRNASNGEALVKKIKDDIGIETRIISGLQEAEYIYYGVKKALKIGSEPSLIMDIGGGSIEFIIGTGNQILWKQSFEVGGQRMVEKFHKSDPMTAEQIQEVKAYLKDELKELFDSCEKFAPKILIGSSGTFDTLSDMYRLKNNLPIVEGATEYPLTIPAFESIYQEILVKNREDRLAIPGMIPLRVDMIVVASALIDFIIASLGITDIRVSAYALKEGVLL
ncbi:MAG: exopolyphosphatase/guanosine-5'-triphosphate,3'-diphosphate pyrophosphatase, partial [Marinoscillum sp.]